MTDLIVPSGAAVIINAASFETALNLKDAVEREVAMSNMGLSLGTALMVDSSPAVRKALWECLVRCTYNNEKIVPATFNDQQKRGDYYDIAFACWKENCSPLVGPLFSLFAEYGLVMKQGNINEGQKSESKISSPSSAPV